MPAIAGPLVAAAGNMLGGYTASLLMGDTSYPKGGNIPGLTSADAGKSGVTPAIQIDPSMALDYFKRAGDAQQENYQKGLDYYSSKIDTATTELTAGVLQANTTLSKLANAGEVSTDQYLKMLGLNARSPSFASPDEVGALGKQYNDITRTMRDAELEQDPTKRAELKSGILWAVNKQNENQLYTLNAQKKAAMDALGPRPVMSDLLAADPGAISLAQHIQTGVKDSYAGKSGLLMGIVQGPGALGERIGKPIADYDKKYKDTQDQWDKTIADWTSKSSMAVDNYDKTYQNDPTYFAYDAAQRQKIIDDNNPALAASRERLIGGRTDIAKPTAESLPNTPGYKFSLQQGQDAVMAAAAKGGMLSSGNTLSAMDKYSQGLAQQIYSQEMGFYLQGAQINDQIESQVANIASNQEQTYMSELSSVMGQGNTATSQTASNYANLGLNVAQLTQSLGSAGMQTYQGIGDALAQSLYHSGDVQNADNIHNMDAQNAMLMQSNSLSAQAGESAGYLTLANNKFGAQQAQLAGYGAAGGGRGSGWPTYTPGAGGTAGSWALG